MKYLLCNVTLHIFTTLKKYKQQLTNKKMKNYIALIAPGIVTETVNVTAKNLSEAKVKASEIGNLVMIALDGKGGNKIHF